MKSTLKFKMFFIDFSAPDWINRRSRLSPDWVDVLACLDTELVGFSQPSVNQRFLHRSRAH